MWVKILCFLQVITLGLVLFGGQMLLHEIEKRPIVPKRSAVYELRLQIEEERHAMQREIERELMQSIAQRILDDFASRTETTMHKLLTYTEGERTCGSVR